MCQHVRQFHSKCMYNRHIFVETLHLVLTTLATIAHFSDDLSPNNDNCPLYNTMGFTKLLVH